MTYEKDNEVQTERLHTTLDECQVNDKLINYFGIIRNHLSRNTIKAAKSVIGECMCNVKQDIEIVEPKLFNKGKLTDRVITKLDEEAKKDKIKEYIKLKQSLEAKLTHLNKDIVIMRSRDSSVGRRRTIYVESEEEFKRKREAANKFIKKMHALENERKRKEATRLTEAVKKSNLEQTLKVSQLEKIRKHKEENIMNQRKLKDNKKQTSILCLTQENYLYKKLEDEYKCKVVIPSLEEHKYILAMRRDRFKPMDWGIIDNHEQKHDRKLKEHSEDRARQLVEQRLKDKQLKRMREKVHLKWLLADMKEKEEQDMRMKYKFELKEKMLNYSKVIKEIVKIRKSFKKEVELKNTIAQLKHPVRERRDNKKLYTISELSKHGRNDIRQSNKNTCNLIKQYTPNVKTKARSVEDVTTVRKKPIDYLIEQRRKRTKLRIDKDWINDLENPKLNLKEKYNLVIRKASRMESEAKMRESILIAKGGDNLEMNENITDMLVEAIKAKLAVLDTI